jgi:hypothetical protein
MVADDTSIAADGPPETSCGLRSPMIWNLGVTSIVTVVAAISPVKVTRGQFIRLNRCDLQPMLGLFRGSTAHGRRHTKNRALCPALGCASEVKRLGKPWSMKHTCYANEHATLRRVALCCSGVATNRVWNAIPRS